MRLPNGILRQFKKTTQIPVTHLSGYLSGNRVMSKSRSILLAKASTELGYNFTAADWMFDPEKIKAALSKNGTPHISQSQAKRIERD